MSTSNIANPLLLKVDRPLPKKIGVIGAGTIGPDIAYYLLSALPELTLYLVDIKEEALTAAAKRIEAYTAKGVKKRKLSEKQAALVNANLVTTMKIADLADCDWVLEAATEDLPLKHKIFADIEAVVSDTALITSNTSSIPAERLFSKLAHPERATVAHFFAPAFQNPAVEVVRAAAASDSTVDYLRWLFAATGKVPLETKDAICFMLDRIFDNWCNDAALLLDGASAAQVDAVSQEFVHAGPFFVLNLANGNPIIIETNTLQMEEGSHYKPAAILGSVDRWKTGKPGSKVEMDDETRSAIRDRLLGILFSQSFDIVDRKIGTSADLDLGCALALGFKAGPLDLMARLGEAEVSRIQKRFVAERVGMPAAKNPVASYQDFKRHVLVDEQDGVKIITLRRPQALNALNDEVNDEVLSVLQQFENDAAVKGFVIVGYGDKAFCAGADIDKFPGVLGDADAAAQYARDCSRLLLHIDSMDKPVVAALNGMALGGGLELALRCHGIVAKRDSWFQFPEVTLGIAPGIGGMTVPYRRWPEAAETFNDMLRRATKLKAGQAHELGIVDALADSYSSLIEAACARVKELPAGKPVVSEKPFSLSLGKVDAVAANGMPLSNKAIEIITSAIEDGAKADSLSKALDIGYAAFGVSACTAAAKEGITAFTQRRKPDFNTTG